MGVHLLYDGSQLTTSPASFWGLELSDTVGQRVREDFESLVHAELSVLGEQPWPPRRVRWIHGGASRAPPLAVDLALMAGNVAQVFISDADWSDALGAVRGALRDEGWLVFETRDPARRAWERWTKEHTYRELEVPDVGLVNTWTELVDVQEPRVSFRHVFRFARGGSELVSDSTLRFRDHDEIAASLDEGGFRLRSVREAPDRPGLELVFFAQREAASPR